MRASILALALWAHLGLCNLPGAELFKVDLGNQVVDLSGTSDFGLPVVAANASVVERGEEQALNALLPRQGQCVGGHSCGGNLCCRNNENCVPAGCCEKPMTQCSVRSCYDRATQLCCADGTVCQKGWVCVPGGGCCPAETPARCGANKCYNPRTHTCCAEGGNVWGCDIGSQCCPGGFCRTSQEKCCPNGSCARDTTCCEKQCCRSIGFCGSSGVCEPCPAATRTRTQTVTRTSTLFARRRRGGADTSGAPEFSCLPMTATNDIGATLELGDDCALEYAPPDEEPTTTAGAAKRDVSEPTPALAPRQANCVPWTTFTDYVTRTVVTTTRATTTVTGQGEPQGDESFSCPAMEVTNAVGDTLAMDEACGLEFTPAEVTVQSGGDDPPAQGGGGSPNTPGSAGAVVGACLTMVWAAMGVSVLMVWA